MQGDRERTRLRSFYAVRLADGTIREVKGDAAAALELAEALVEQFGHEVPVLRRTVITTVTTTEWVPMLQSIDEELQAMLEEADAEGHDR